jgi:hypothetical protein
MASYQPVRCSTGSKSCIRQSKQVCAGQNGFRHFPASLFADVDTLQGGARPNLVYEHVTMSQVRLCSITLIFSRFMFDLRPVVCANCTRCMLSHYGKLLCWNEKVELSSIIADTVFCWLSRWTVIIYYDDDDDEAVPFVREPLEEVCQVPHGLAEFAFGFHICIVVICPVLSHLNAVHTLPPYFFEIYFNTIPSSTARPTKWPLYKNFVPVTASLLCELAELKLEQ